MITFSDIRRGLFRSASWPALLFVFGNPGFLPTRIPAPACPLLAANPVQARQQLIYTLITQDRAVRHRHVRWQRRFLQQTTHANRALHTQVLPPIAHSPVSPTPSAAGGAPTNFRVRR